MDEGIKMEVVDEESEVQLPGFRFHPTDEELVGFYLKRKVEKKPLRIELIKQVDIYKYDPWDLPKSDVVKEKEWYFFCIRGRKYRNSVRPNRVTGSGFWKATGIDKPIHSAKQPHECIGLKKSLVYYRGSAGKGTKTDWMMHEFRLPPCGKDSDHVLDAKSIAQEAEVWTLCRIFKRVQSHKKYPTEIKGSNIINQNRQVNSSLKTSSFGSDCTEQCISFCGSPVQQTQEMKPNINHLDERNYFLLGHLNSVAQTPFPISYSDYWNLNGEDPLTYGNWDELRPMVDRVITPSQAFDCT